MATIVRFVKSVTAGLSINPNLFLGAVISDAGRMEVNFEKTTNAATGTSLVDLDITDGANGVEQKRAFQALANALGGHPRHGAVVEVVDDINDTSIHRNIISLNTLTL
tara:strand:- start:1069 stop:1392 length:324 start_codon:yes stop_codon:yes gene_type:complete